MSMTFSFAGMSPEHSLNVSNTNSYEIQRMIGVDEPDCCGEIDAQTLLSSLVTIDPSSHTRAQEDNHGIAMSDEGIRPEVRFISGALTEDKIEFYVDRLRTIATLALEAGEQVYWG